MRYAVDSLSAEGLRLGGANLTGTRQHCRSRAREGWNAAATGAPRRRLTCCAGHPAAAPAYSFSNSDTFNINGAGIVNTSAFAPTFTNTGNFSFNNTSSAGNAVIVNNGGGVVSFNNASSAANATITTNDGALTQFNDNSTGGNAQFITAAGGIVDFSNTAGPAGDGNISAGSIAGAGNYYLGSNLLTVAGNNLSTTVSGVISDCGDSGSDCSNAGATALDLCRVAREAVKLLWAS